MIFAVAVVAGAPLFYVWFAGVAAAYNHGSRVAIDPVVAAFLASFVPQVLVGAGLGYARNWIYFPVGLGMMIPSVLLLTVVDPPSNVAYILFSGWPLVVSGALLHVFSTLRATVHHRVRGSSSHP